MLSGTILYALIGSLLLHLSLLWWPGANRGAELVQPEKGTELRISLARSQPPAAPVLESDPTPPPVIEKPAESTPEPKPEPKTVEKKPPEPVISSQSPAPQKINKPREKVVEKVDEPAKPEAASPKVVEPVQTVPLLTKSEASGEEEVTQQAASSDTVHAMKAWQAELQQRINRNRHYPRQALRRGLQGDVQVKAVICPDGSLRRADVLSGHRSFKSSSLKTLNRSLPFPPPEGTKDDITITFTIRYAIQ